jgi:hypothetical protein
MYISTTRNFACLKMQYLHLYNLIRLVIYGSELTLPFLTFSQLHIFGLHQQMTMLMFDPTSLDLSFCFADSHENNFSIPFVFGS